MKLSEIKQKVINGDYQINIVKEAPYLPSGYTFSDEITVAENKRRVDEYNAEVRKKRMELLCKQSELDNRLRTDLFDYIVETFGLTNEQGNGCIDWVDIRASSYDGPAKYFNVSLGMISLLSVVTGKPCEDICEIAGVTSWKDIL